MRLIASGDRPSCFAALSSVIEDLANSMSRRSSLNDQGLRAILAMILSYVCQDKAAERTHVRSTALLVWGRTWGGPGVEMDRSFRELRNKQRGLS